MSQIKAVISVLGRDQKGVVARFATYLAQHGVNIEDILQQVVHGQFIMDMLVDLADLTIRLDELIQGLLEVGNEIDMEVRVALHHEGRLAAGARCRRRLGRSRSVDAPRLQLGR